MYKDKAALKIIQFVSPFLWREHSRHYIRYNLYIRSQPLFQGFDISIPTLKQYNCSLSRYVCHWYSKYIFQVMCVPGVSCPVMRGIFDAVRHRVHLAILHDHLHPQRGLPLGKHARLHPAKEYQGLLHRSLAPGWCRCIVPLQFLSALVADVCLAPGRTKTLWHGSATGGPRANCGPPVNFLSPSNYSDRSSFF